MPPIVVRFPYLSPDCHYHNSENSAESLHFLAEWSKSRVGWLMSSIEVAWRPSDCSPECPGMNARATESRPVIWAYHLNNPGRLKPVLLFSAMNYTNFTNFPIFFVLIRGWFLLCPMIYPHFLRRYIWATTRSRPYVAAPPDLGGLTESYALEPPAR